ncbi:MAG: glycoside hydrolase family 16 protein [Melioribacteraceae bacterium]|nr:glycoside hydrolase family 16 protein [Melioribacteraceae bacterium]
MKIKNLISISLFISSFILGCNSEESINTPQVGSDPDSVKVEGYKLVWSDEFNIDGKPDTTKWGYDIWNPGRVNDELQYYTSDSVNVRVNNGKLEIEVQYFPNPVPQYTSARIVSREKGDWKYGRVEVKAKLPAGLGTWPAIWMLPTDWAYGDWPKSGEIDIMEHVGWNPNVIFGTVHTESYNHIEKTQVGKSITIPTAIYDFHVYAIDWDEDKIDFFVDGEKYFTFENENISSAEWPFDQRFHLIMNVALGGWGGVVDDTIFPVQMDIEYVRVYKKVE